MQTEDSLNNDVEKKRFVRIKQEKSSLKAIHLKREEEEVGESIICVMNRGEMHFGETKVKLLHTEITIPFELVDTSGNVTKLLEGKEFVYASNVYYTPYV